MKYRNYIKSLLAVGLSLQTAVCAGQSLVKSDTNKSGDLIYAETSSEMLIDEADGQFGLELALQRRYFLNQANVIIKIQTDVDNPSVVDSSSPCQISFMPEKDYEQKNKLLNMSLTKQDTAVTTITGTLLLSDHEVEVLRQKCVKSVRLSTGNLSFERLLTEENRNLFIRLFALLDGTE